MAALLQLQKLRVCADFAVLVVFPHAVGHDTLAQLAAAPLPLDALKVHCLLQSHPPDTSTLETEDQHKVGGAISQFRTLFVVRQLDENIGDGLHSACELLQEQMSTAARASGTSTAAVTPIVSPIAGTLVQAALTALQLVGPRTLPLWIKEDFHGRPLLGSDDEICRFGGLQPLFEAALRVLEALRHHVELRDLVHERADPD